MTPPTRASPASEKTGLTIAVHQARTVANYLELRSLAPELPFVPVLQGWRLDDYLRAAEMYARAGIDLTREPLVGVGSVCRRQATSEVEDVSGGRQRRRLGALHVWDLPDHARDRQRYILALRSRQQAEGELALDLAQLAGLPRPRDEKAPWHWREVEVIPGLRHVVVYSAFKARHDFEVRDGRVPAALEKVGRHSLPR